MAVAKRLKQQGYTLAILSNHSREWFEDLSTRFHLCQLFDEQLTVVSYAIGCAKPLSVAYERLMERLQVVIPDIRRSECLFIDDSVENTTAAERSGFKVLQFDASKQSVAELKSGLERHGIHV